MDTTKCSQIKKKKKIGNYEKKCLKKIENIESGKKKEKKYERN